MQHLYTENHESTRSGTSRSESFEDALRRVLAEAARRRVTLHELTTLYMKQALETTGGKKGEAARLLGIDRKTLYRNDPTRD